MNIPFHPDWIVTFWLTTPGLNKIDPHLVLVLLAAALFVAYYVRRKKKPVVVVDREEEQFRLLLARKNLLEKELTELKQEHEIKGTLEPQLMKKKIELEKHLNMTNKKLEQYISLTDR